MQTSVTVFGLLLIASSYGRVVDNFGEQNCIEFFYNNFEPQGLDSNNDDRICQTFLNVPRFATLYSTHRRIPVYSAYIFENRKHSPRSSSSWFVEPQLVDRSWENNQMTAERLEKIHGTDINVIGQTQAVNEDYKKESLPKQYNRGHLNPRSHHDGDASRATYTLTNVVPQDAKVNRQAWSLYENNFPTGCNKAFVLVGAIPSADIWVIRDDLSRVNIPEFLWRAYCCVDSDGNPVKSGGATVKNTANNGGNTVQEDSVENLQQFLTAELGRGQVNLFDNCNAPVTAEEDRSSISL